MLLFTVVFVAQEIENTFADSVVCTESNIERRLVQHLSELPIKKIYFTIKKPTDQF